MDQTWLHGVEIDQADGFAAALINHHVVDLGVAMDRALLQLPALQGGFQNIDALASSLDEGSSTANGGVHWLARFVDDIVTIQIRWRDMEMFECVFQLVCRQIADQAVEHAEPVAHLASVVAVEDHIGGGGGTDVGDGTPELSVLLHPMSVLPAANHLWHFPASALEFRRR